MLACSSISPAENGNSQIGHWTQEMGGELSGEETHSTCGDEDGDKAGEAGGGGEAPPQVAACWGSMSMLKEPAQMGHHPLSWALLLRAWGRRCSLWPAFAGLCLFGREFELDTGLRAPTFLLFVLPTSFSAFCSSDLGSALC